MKNETIQNVPRMAGLLFCLCAGVLLYLPSASAAPLGTAFTYQGSLKLSGVPVMSTANMSFSLWDAAVGGTQVAGPVAVNGVNVVDGLFTVQIDFGQQVFNGDARWLQTVVNGTTLTPRQALTATPYALQTRGIFVNNNGNVGIGTTNPLWPLHIFGSQVVARLESFNAPNGPTLELRNNLASPNLDGAINFVNSAGNVRGQFGYRGADNAMSFVVNNAERVRITSNGNVGIGTTNPLAQIHLSAPQAIARLDSTNSVLGSTIDLRNNTVSPTLDGAIRFINSAGSARGLIAYRSVDNAMTFATNLAEQMRITSSGLVGIGTASPTSRLHVSGNIQCTGTFSASGDLNAANVFAGGVTAGVNGITSLGTIHANGEITSCSTIRAQGNIVANQSLCVSDKRFKKNVQTLAGALDKFEKIRPVIYDWNWDEYPGRNFNDEKQIGLIAQELREIYPSLVVEDDDGYLAVDYSRLTPVIIQVVRELRDEKDRQLRDRDGEIGALKAENDAMRARLDRLEKALNAK